MFAQREGFIENDKLDMLSFSVKIIVNVGGNGLGAVLRPVIGSSIATCNPVYCLKTVDKRESGVIR